MEITLSVAPTVEPVSVVEAKEHLRVDGGDEDDYIGALITAAREWAETFTRRQFLQATYILHLDSFPGQIVLPRPPLISVTTVEYVDTAGTTREFSSANYDQLKDTLPGRIVLGYGQSWPSTRAHAQAVIVTYKAGYGTAASDVPMPIRHAVKMLAAHWFENREQTIVGISISRVPVAAEALLWPYRVLEVWS
ncbi:MAG TPA: head-tail connector protein [Vicinamibacterales bacterium]|nr:head-tail connector protein [Vicinamibacterales bacterium]